MSCRGNPGTEVTGNLTVFINTLVSNRILSGNTVDVNLTVENGSGPVMANASAALSGNTQITFSGLRFTFGAGGQANLLLSNLRGDATFNAAPMPGTPGQPPIQPITARLAFSGGGQLLNFTTTTFQVAVAQRGLAATVLGATVPCRVGSPLPEHIGFSQLLNAGTAFGTTRVTEGFESSYAAREPQTDHGTRIMLRFSGFIGGARLFAPSFIAGSSAAAPTSAGDFDAIPNPGAYVPNSRTLLLTRVVFTDPNGAGGQLVSANVPGPPDFNQMTEVPLTSGGGVAVYEVVDSNPLALEWAQIPVFLGLPRTAEDRNVEVMARPSFAPLSTAPMASDTAPIPRFRDVDPVSDCGGYGDCDRYFPKLQRSFELLNFSLIQGVGTAEGNIGVVNGGGGTLRWSAQVQYKNGNDWIRLHQTAGVGGQTIRFIVAARPDMPPGTYEATVRVDAGAAGTLDYPVVLRVLAVPAPVVPRPAVSEVVHGATFQAGPIVRGSFVTLRGRNFSGNNLRVSIDGKPARILFSNSEQINVQVPDQLSGNTVPIVVSMGDVAGDPVSVAVATVNPGIFNPGIVNQDGSVNSANNPANTGSYVQIYATGLLPPDGSGTVEAKLHDVMMSNLPYAGPAPGLAGLQQVNLRVLEGWPTMTTEVLLCTTASSGRVCSSPVKIHVRAAQ
jgi:uncharacterized protein (TIGR03437 family)